jgi:serine protease Do
MIQLYRISLCLLTIATALSLRAADVPPPPGGDHRPGHKFERHVSRHPGKGEKENVTFLGVETAPVSPTLTAQLKLPNSAGLIVAQVVPDSPASAALQAHDILLKLDDQLLIDPRQFSVLIRNHAEGDSVTLTYIRAGKQATAVVKLVKREVPKFAGFHPWNSELPPPPFAGHAFEFGGRGEADHVLDLVGPGPRMQTRAFHGKPGPHAGFRGTRVNTGNSNMVYSDQEGSLELTIKDGQKTLVARNPKGEQVFSGSVTTPEERKALPPELLERLDRIEGMDEFSFETDDGFRDHLRTFAPEHRKIMVPLPPSSEEHPRASVL